MMTHDALRFRAHGVEWPDLGSHCAMPMVFPVIRKVVPEFKHGFSLEFNVPEIKPYGGPFLVSMMGLPWWESP